MSPVHSVIVPVYNAAPWLAQCLDSIAAQPARDWECICVDDGSTDGSGAILDEYAGRDPRFRVIHQANAGPGAARNAGLDRARGEWVSFVDSDDMVRADYFSAFNALPEKADIVFFQLTRIDGDGIRHNYTFPSGLETGVRSTRGEMESLAVQLVLNDRNADMFGWSCNKFVRRSLVESVGARFDIGVHCYEDELFALKLLRGAESVRLLPRCLYLYRWRDGCLTSRRDQNLDGLAQRYEAAMEGFRTDAFRSLQYTRLFLLLDEILRKDSTAENLERLAGFWLRHRRFLRVPGWRRRMLLRLSCASPAWAWPGVARAVLRRLPSAPPKLLWYPEAGKWPISIGTFFV